MSKITFFPQSCKGVEDCGICIFICPKQVLLESDDLNEAGYVLPKVGDESLCTGCQNCMIYCPDFAIVVERATSGSSARKGHGDE
jgi:2-oxoglutarate ferredoxin oxidoreductase subunit delta